MTACLPTAVTHATSANDKSAPNFAMGSLSMHGDGLLGAEGADGVLIAPYEA